jgi:cobalt/nickel transport system permease protein
VLVATLHFMDRYAGVLAGERNRMMLARRARSFSRHGRLGMSALGGLLAALFVRSMERGERVHSAMLARGWDGTLRSLDN